MKLLFVLLAGVFLTVTASRVAAIPQTVGGLFINASGNPRHLPVEDWFKEPGHWQLSKLPQVPWSTGKDPFGRVLESPGTVFGMTARSLTVDITDKGEITNVSITYDADALKITKSDLVKRLARNVATHMGGKQESVKGNIHVAGDVYSVTIAPLDGNAVAVLLKR